MEKIIEDRSELEHSEDQLWDLVETLSNHGYCEEGLFSIDTNELKKVVTKFIADTKEEIND
jgi:hypothetical protein